MEKILNKDLREYIESKRETSYRIIAENAGITESGLRRSLGRKRGGSRNRFQKHMYCDTAERICIAMNLDPNRFCIK